MKFRVSVKIRFFFANFGYVDLFTSTNGDLT